MLASSTPPPERDLWNFLRFRPVSVRFSACVQLSCFATVSSCGFLYGQWCPLLSKTNVSAVLLTNLVCCFHIVTVLLRNIDVLNTSSWAAETQHNVCSHAEYDNPYSCEADLAISAVISKSKYVN